MKFLLFGTGDYYRRYKKWFRSEDIAALLDNSAQKQYTIMDGIEVLPPEDGVKLPFDAVVILSFYVKDMKGQLINLGVDVGKIFHFYDLHSLLPFKMISRKACFYGGAKNLINSREQNDTKILLLSQELSLGGPSIALFHAAKVLKKHGYKVVYASMLDGPLREKLAMDGIPVVIDENLQIAVMNELQWINGFSMLICNTINFHIFLMDRNKDVPIIWWLHDAPFFYDGVRRENLNKISRENLKVVSVGPVPKRAMQQFMSDISISELLYGVIDNNQNEVIKEGNSKLRLVLIGFLENIKGQDILLEAIESLQDEVKEDIEVILAGHDETLFAEQLKEQYKGRKGIQFTGSVDRKRIHEILSHADILVCPSRQDSMPTVAAEAMMHGVPCIVSDAIGTAVYIHDGKDGLIFHNEDVKALADKIMWCKNHRAEVEIMGKNARKLYEQVFSIEVFEKNLLHIVEENM